MTCIVGIIEKGKRTVIGGDSAGVAGLDITIRKDVKVFKVQEFVIGCTSSFRMIQLIRFSFNPPKKYDDEDIYKYMCTSFIDALRDCLKKGGYARRENEEEKGGCFLVAWKDRLFQINSDYQVGESIDNHDSVGCGESFALGALDAMDEGITMTTEEKVKKALEVATYRSAGVRPPYTILST